MSTTLRLAVESRRADGTLPIAASASARDLAARFHPEPRTSLRALLGAMDSSQTKPWCVILCRFNDAQPRPDVEDPVEKLYRDLFAGGAGGIGEYWRDASLAHVDVRNTQVFGWLTVAIPRSQAGGSAITNPTGPGRVGLCNLAIAALQATGQRTDGFAGFIAVYTENWSKDGVAQQGPWASWAPFWLDGSAAGNLTTLTPPHAADIITHEMGHGFGLSHDRTPGLTTDYADPCCIMSQRPLWYSTLFGSNFGPRLCATHLLLNGWMWPHRVLTLAAGWPSTNTDERTVPLAPTDDAGAAGNLIAVLPAPNANPPWDYHLEYARPSAWNRGLAADTVFVRRTGPDESNVQTSLILGSLPVPADPAQTATFSDPLGGARFTARRQGASGRVALVTAS